MQKQSAETGTPFEEYDFDMMEENAEAFGFAWTNALDLFLECETIYVPGRSGSANEYEEPTNEDLDALAGLLEERKTEIGDEPNESRDIGYAVRSIQTEAANQARFNTLCQLLAAIGGPFDREGDDAAEAWVQHFHQAEFRDEMPDLALKLDAEMAAEGKISFLQILEERGLVATPE